MNYYDEDDLIEVTNHFEQFIAPKDGTVVQLPIKHANTINAIYYIIYFQDGKSITVRMSFSPTPVIEFVETDIKSFDLLISLFNYIYQGFVNNSTHLWNYFHNAQKIKSIGRRHN